eukprot:7700172-Pyramimonas_sp.AAC.1
MARCSKAPSAEERPLPSPGGTERCQRRASHHTSTNQLTRHRRAGVRRCCRGVLPAVKWKVVRHFRVT